MPKQTVNSLFIRISRIIENAKGAIATVVNAEMVSAGWSASHLWHVRQFYLLYNNMIPINLHTLRAELSWSHYRILMRIDKPQARSLAKVMPSNRGGVD